MTESCVFDSNALLKLFQKEEGYQKVTKIVRDLRTSGGRALMNAINYGEIIYITKRSFGDQRKIECLAAMELIGIKVLPVTTELIIKAAAYKGELETSGP